MFASPSDNVCSWLERTEFFGIFASVQAVRLMGLHWFRQSDMALFSTAARNGIVVAVAIICGPKHDRVRVFLLELLELLVSNVDLLRCGSCHTSLKLTYALG